MIEPTGFNGFGFGEDIKFLKVSFLELWVLTLTYEKKISLIKLNNNKLKDMVENN
jgi:hypothetical protein